MSNTTIEQLVAEKGKEYGEAWLTAGLLLGTATQHSAGGFTRIATHGYAYAWTSIMGKLARALEQPDNPDHWRDIAGYATLVLNNIERSTTSTEPQESITNDDVQREAEQRTLEVLKTRIDMRPFIDGSMKIEDIGGIIHYTEY